MLLEQALTHKSFGRDNNERLEFLGDAVLGYVIAQRVFEDQPGLAEDSLTLLRASLVRKDTLVDIAAALQLGDYLRLGLGERKSGGRQRASILADALEAVIGAVGQDGGIEAARELINHVFGSRLDNLRNEIVKDAKTRLQETLQAMARGLPAYEVVATAGSDHERTFTVSCRVSVFDLEALGKGSSRRAAEQAAAAEMIERMADHE